jgi:hypothetical protein
MIFFLFRIFITLKVRGTNVAQLHHFQAAPVPGKIFDAAPAPAPQQVL